MRWGCVAEYASDIAFFGGRLGGKTIALLGSSDSIIGAPNRADSNHAPFYYTLRFFNQMLQRQSCKLKDGGSPTLEETGEDNPPYYGYAESVSIARRALKGSDANLEFLALVLHQEDKLVVATPLYVALAV
jgi:hypothetical protein